MQGGNRRWVFAMAVGALLHGAVHAQEAGGVQSRLTPAQIAEIGLTPRQIELLDRYLQPPPPRPAAGPPVETQRYETPQGAPRDPDSLIGYSDGPIRSRLVGEVASWEPGTVFVLGNGQQWKVLKGTMRLRRPLQAPEVMVVPGIAGRWFLQVHEDYPKARVYRID